MGTPRVLVEGRGVHMKRATDRGHGPWTVPGCVEPVPVRSVAISHSSTDRNSPGRVTYDHVVCRSSAQTTNIESSGMPCLLTRNRQWVGMIGNCKARVQAYRCGPYLFYHHAAIGQLEKQIRDLKCSLDKELKKRDRTHKMEISALKLEIHTLTECFDTTYQYDRFQVVELTQLICRNLEDKPPEIDSNRIFNCIKNCVHDCEKGLADNPEHLDLDVRMLLYVCRASTWFTSNQIDCFCSWCQNIDL